MRQAVSIKISESAGTRALRGLNHMRTSCVAVETTEEGAARASIGRSLAYCHRYGVTAAHNPDIKPHGSRET